MSFEFERMRERTYGLFDFPPRHMLDRSRAHDAIAIDALPAFTRRAAGGGGGCDAADRFPTRRLLDLTQAPLNETLTSHREQNDE